jgi:hypothetical protein
MSPDKNILSIDSDDDNEDYLKFSEHLNDDTKRKKNHIANEIEEIGQQLLNEIDRKNKEKLQIVKKMIPYILKNCNGKYDEEELIGYSFNDVQDIYDEIKEQKRPIIVKFFRFIFNL